MIYLVKNGERVLTFYSESEMKKAGFAKAGKTVSDEQFAAKGCQTRIIAGAIVVGKTEAEKQSEKLPERVSELKRLFADTDYIDIKIMEG